MAWAAVALGAAQLGYSVYKSIKAAKDKAPLDNVPDPKEDNTALKYEQIYRNLADKAATTQLTAANRGINQNRVNTVGTASQVFKDPILRFRASTLASTKANEASIKARLASENTRFSYLKSAENAGLSQRTYNRRLWSDLMGLRARQQGLYDKRQMATGAVAGAGIHNIVGGIDDIDFKGKKTNPVDVNDSDALTGDLATDGIDVGNYDAYGND